MHSRTRSAPHTLPRPVGPPGTRVLVQALVAASVIVVVPAWGQDSVTVRVAASTQFGAGGLHRALFGSAYRRTWTTPIRVPVLDLQRVAGGLTPTTAGGGMQTKSLRFRGADGHEYGFRSVEKGLSDVPPPLQGTLLERLALDQNSSQYPAAAPVVAALSEAAGLLHTTPVLVILPDDPALGEHRERFKLTLGTFERRATVPPDAAPFGGAREIIPSHTLLERMAASTDHRVDVPTFLKARLFDLWIGDRDRHRGQWTWARLSDDLPVRWVPIPEDRDQAFIRFDGLVLDLVRLMTGQMVEFEAGELLEFGPEYAPVVGATWGGRELDRRLLVELPWSVWDSVIRDLQAGITDAEIAGALRRLPSEYRALDGPELARVLAVRRERLPAMAARFYRLLAFEPEIHGTDGPDLLTIERAESGHARVQLAPRARPDTPYFSRTFTAHETDELRIVLQGGPDSVVVTGAGAAIRVRVVGSGDDVVIDRGGAGNIHLYTPTGTDRTGGARAVRVDRRPYRPPWLEEDRRLPPRDWGHMWDPMLLAAAGPDVGFLLGGGPRYTRYGFWKYPYAYRVQVRAGVATGPPTGVGDLRLTAYRLNSRVRGDLRVRASGIDVLRYHGLGNDVTLTQPDDYYRVNQARIEVTPSVGLPLSDRVRFRIGPTARYSSTRTQAGRIIAATTPYGSGSFGQVGADAELEWDARPAGTANILGAAGFLRATVVPPVWDVDSTFVALHGEAVAHLGTEAVWPRPVLALRAGGRLLLGGYPFHEASFIGDQRTVRLGRQNRYGGDAAVYGNAELRVRLTSVMLMVPGEVGVLGLADVGRVFLEGESSDTWHTAFGGGLWLALLDRRNALHVTVARGAERTAVYLGIGFAY